MEKKFNKILLVSSSGGHFEELKMLKFLDVEKNKLFWVTERTNYKVNVDFYLIQTGIKDPFWLFKMFINAFKSLYFFLRTYPDFVISTGTMVSIPFFLIARLFGKKTIFIETFARVNDTTLTGKFLYKFSNLFIVQWEENLKFYPKAIFGGSIF